MRRRGPTKHEMTKRLEQRNKLQLVQELITSSIENGNKEQEFPQARNVQSCRHTNPMQH